ncbi:MAG: cadherin-like domain-containing protein [Saprospiraceae bacterium]
MNGHPIRQLFLFICCIVFVFDLQGQQHNTQTNFWSELSVSRYHLDYAAFARYIQGAAPSTSIKIDLPLPDGTFATFLAKENSNFHPKLSAEYPEIKAFRAVLPTQVGKEVRFSISHKRLRLIYAWEGKRYLLEAEDALTSEVYRMLTVDELPIPPGFDQSCGVDGDGYSPEWRQENTENARARGFNLRVFELAIACTGEYAQFHGGTKADVLAAMNETLLHVNAVYETELAIRLEIVPGNSQLIFLDPLTDPFTEGDKEAMFQENQTTCSQYLGLSKFDIGHVFNTTFGGLASISSICNYSRKGKGVSGLETPEGYYFDLIVMHEIGHQFGAKHTQNNDCNITPSAAFEPGSGSTIMSYAGICEPNVKGLPDDYFHGESLKTISRIVRSGVTAFCVENIEIDNKEPTVNAGPNHTIPILTPFELKGTGYDPDGDPLLYNWEQFDNEVVTHPPRPDYTSGPIFRSYPPTTSPNRMIPAQNFLLNNVEPIWEVLPSVNRQVHFQLSVRDNHDGVGISDYDEMILIFSEEAGPFLVTQPSSRDQYWFIGHEVDIIWDVAKTDQEPINCQSVNILLSQDGGLTFPITLAEGVPNNGQFSLTVPNLPSTKNRIKIAAADNIFFDISNHNFMIMDQPAPSVSVEVNPPLQEDCVHFGVLTFELSANAFWGFEEDLHIEVISKPAGTKVELSSPVVPVNGSMVVAVLEDGGAPIGSSAVELRLTGSDTVLMVSLPLLLDGPPTTLPSWYTPSVGMEIFSPNVLLNWNVVESATAYQVEMATNPSFGGTTVLNQETTNEFILFQGLQKGLVYYWRVTAKNECGAGASTPITAFRSSNLPTLDKDLTIYTHTFPAFAGDTRPITNAYLRAVSNCCEEEEVIYTLLELPHFGRLIFNGVELGLGGQFTQGDINAGDLHYLSMGNMGTNDFFRFSVQSDRGWIVSQTLDIEVVDTQINLLSENHVICGATPAVFTFGVVLAAEGVAVTPSVSGLPNGLVGTFEPANLTTSGEVKLIVSQVSPVQSPGNINFAATFAFGDLTQNFELDLVVVPGAAPPNLLTPANAVTVDPLEFQMSWQGIGVSSAYIVQIAENPAFESLLVNDTISNNTYKWTAAQEEAFYYWRIIAVGACGNSLPSETRTVKTGFEDCQVFTLENKDLSQLENGLLPFNVPAEELVNKVRIQKIRLLHETPKFLSIDLVAPSGTNTTLLNQPDCDGQNLLLRLDDAASNSYSSLSQDCQESFYYALAGIYRPFESLQRFRGEPANGNWQLRFEQVQGTLAGTLEEVSVEICSFNKDPQSFSLLKNQTLWLYPRQEAKLTLNFLKADDTEIAPEDIVFVIAATPEKGQLKLDGVPLGIGDEFTQFQLNKDQVTYRANTTERTNDRFKFMVKAPKGRFIAEQDFNIEILGGDWYAESYDHKLCAGQTTAVVSFFKAESLPTDGISFTIDGLPSGVTADFVIQQSEERVDMELSGLEQLSNAVFPMSITMKGNNWQLTTGILVEKKLNPGFAFLRAPYNGIKIAENKVMLEWFEENRADRYLLEVATRPSFGNTTFVHVEVTRNQYQLLNIPLGAVYYWRVTALNDCGEGESSQPFAFQRIKPFCEDFKSTHTPQTFGQALSGTTTGWIDVNNNWPISKVSLKDIRVYHPDLDQVRGALVSPEGTSIRLFEKPLDFSDCENETLLMNFSDDAIGSASAYLNLCDEATLFDLNATLRSIDPFANMTGERGGGTWGLQLENQLPTAATGLLETWTLEVCFDTLLGAASFQEEELVVTLGSQEVLNANYLETTMTGTELREITYILTVKPAYGDLLLNGVALKVGNTFNQFDINEGRLRYVHNGPNMYFDGFYFNIHFPNDLWWPNRYFSISLIAPEPDWTVSVESSSACLEEANVGLEIAVAGDYGPYLYSLDNEHFQTDFFFEGLNPGIYTVYLKYWNGQLASKAINVEALSAQFILHMKTLDISATGGFPPYAYQLDDGAFQVSSQFVGLKSGLHEVTIRDEAGCLITLSLNVPFTIDEGVINIPLPPFVTEGMPLPEAYQPFRSSRASNALQVFPNPGDGLFHLKWDTAPSDEPRKLWVMNSSGQVLQDLEISLMDDRISLDLRRLPNGVYRLLWQEGTRLEIKQVVVYH